jgi:hypothetical protein
VRVIAPATLAERGAEVVVVWWGGYVGLQEIGWRKWQKDGREQPSAAGGKSKSGSSGEGRTGGFRNGPGCRVRSGKCVWGSATFEVLDCC